jgi:DNA-binding MarR family transcriptional regulator
MIKNSSNSKIELNKNSDALLRNFIWDIQLLSSNLKEIRKCWAQVIGIPLSQLNIILIVDHLDEGEGVSVGSVAKKLNIKSTFITNHSMALENGKYLKRIQSKLDRRNILLSLTKKSNQAIEKIFQMRKEVYSMIFGVGSKDDFKMVVEYISSIKTSSRKAAKKLKADI